MQPSVRGGKWDIGVGAEEVEGVACFMDEDGEIAVDAVEHCDVAVRVVGISIVGWIVKLVIRDCEGGEWKRATYGQVG